MIGRKSNVLCMPFSCDRGKKPQDPHNVKRFKEMENIILMSY